MFYPAEGWKFSAEKEWLFSTPKYSGWLCGMKTVKCNIVSSVMSEQRAEVWVWAALPLPPGSKLYFVVKLKMTMLWTTIKKQFLTFGDFKAGAKTWVGREGGGWHGSVCTCVSAGAGSSSFSVSLPQSPRLASLRGTSEGPKLCWQSVLSRLMCRVRHTPLTPASCSPAATPVSPAFRMQRSCCCSPLARQPCLGTWPVALIHSPLWPPCKDRALTSPQGSPQAAPLGALPLCLHGQQNTSWKGALEGWGPTSCRKRGTANPKLYQLWLCLR